MSDRESQKNQDQLSSTEKEGAVTARTGSAALDSFCKAYLDLPLRERSRFIHWFAALDKGSKWGDVLRYSGLLSGSFRPQYLRDNYEHMHTRIDAALLRPARGESRIPMIVARYIWFLEPAWLAPLREFSDRDEDGDAPQGTSSATKVVKLKLDDDDPWARVMAALLALPDNGMGLQAVLTEPTHGGAPDSCEQESEVHDTMPANTPTESSAEEQSEESAWLESLGRLGSQAREVVEAATAAKSFTQEEVDAIFRELHDIGSRMRERVRQLAAAHGRECPEWATLSDLETLTAELQALSRQKKELESARALLIEVADALRRVTTLKIRLRSRREELLGVRQEAASQLDSAAQLATPPRLPQPASSGIEWLRNVYALSDEALDEVIDRLDKTDLRALGRFVGHTSWEQLEFEAFPELPESSPAHGGDSSAHARPALPEGQTCETLQAEGQEVGTRPAAFAFAELAGPDPNAQEPERKDVRDDSAEDGTRDETGIASNEPAPAAAPSHDRTEDADIGGEPVSKTGRNEPTARTAAEATAASPAASALGGAVVAAHEPDEEGALDDAEGAHSADGADKEETAEEPGHVGVDPLSATVLDQLATKGLWRLAAEYVRVAGQPPCPPPAVFRILAFHPAVLAAESVPTPRLAAQFEGLVSVPPPEMRDQVILWWAACVVPAMGLPMPSARAILRSLPAASLPDCLAAIANAVVDLTDRVPAVTAIALRGGTSRAEWEQSLAKLRREAGELHENSLRQTILYQPATEVWRWLNREGTLGRLAKALTDGGSDDVGEIRQVLESHLRDLRSFQGLIDAADRKLYTRPRGIEARASLQMFERSRQFRQLGERWIALQQAQPKGNYISENVARFRGVLSGAMPQVAEFLDKTGNDEDGPLARCARLAVAVAKSGIECLLEHSPETLRPADYSEEATEAELLQVPGLRLGTDWQLLTPDDEAREAIQQHAVHGTEPVDAFRGRIEVGDVRGARLLLDYCQGLRADGSIEALEGEIEQGALLWGSQIRRALDGTRQEVAALRSTGGVGEGAIAEVESDLIRLGVLAGTTDQYDVLQRELAALGQRIAGLRDARNQGMLQQLDELRERVPPEDIQRVKARINAGDMLTAREYLGRLQASGSLGELGAATRDPLLQFFPETATVLDEELARDSGCLQRALGRSGGDVAGLRLGSVPGAQRDTAAAMLDAWSQLKKMHGQLQGDALAGLLGHLGFHVLEVGRTEPVPDGLLAEIRCEPIEDRRICPTPSFGSACGGRYDVLQFWSRPDEEKVLYAVGDRSASQRPAIVLWYGRMTQAKRRDLSRLCRERLRTFILLDETLLAFLCAERGFRLPTFFQCSLPFAYSDPFVTAASLVPPEMFFGREKELANLQDVGSGSCFVYGGRQLGKTALLREAQRRFHAPREHRYAIWFDLLSVGIGTEKGPESIWTELEAEFEELRLPDFEAGGAGKSSVAGRESRFERRVRAWLTAHHDGRILLLLDETDRFLEQDAENDYAQARRLKGLMDATHRRFKVVFAGLHNVQRTTRQSNHPLAHLGEPINVGAFSVNGDWSEAMRLVTEPFRALGYRFEQPDLVTRILAICNFYPGLIQDFCSRLLRLMNERRPDGPPFPIREEDVEQICENSELRDFIKSRFQLTLQLDPRYHVIAYTLALKFHEEREKTDAGYLPDELQRTAADFWDKGFRGMNPDDFASLLDEMCGLGVLRSQHDNRYALRNPNLLLLLGDEDRIQEQLLNAPRETGKYHPRTFHARRRDSSSPRRNPLTIAQEGIVLDPSPGCVLVLGSGALAAGDLVPALKERKLTGQRVIQFTHPDPSKEFAAWLTQRVPEQDGKEAVVIVFPHSEHWEVSSCEAAEQVIAGARKAPRRARIAFCITPGQWWKTVSASHDPGSMDRIRVVPILKWHDSFVHRWLEDCGVPISDSSELDELLAIASGWPLWLYRFVDTFGRKRDTLREAKSSLAAWMTDPEGRAERLAAYGLSAGEADRPLEIMQGIRSLQTRPDERITETDMEVYLEELGIDAATFRAFLGWAETFGFLDQRKPGEWMWDRVFVRDLDP